VVQGPDQISVFLAQLPAHVDAVAGFSLSTADSARVIITGGQCHSSIYAGVQDIYVNAMML
jgi:hypothetical protein